MMHSPNLPMHAAFARLSPRLNPRPVPWYSRAISVAVVLLFAALVAQAFFRQGLASWSVGIVYIVYDTFLLAFTAVHIARLSRAPDLAAMPDAVRPAMAVIIAARNEASVLGITIDTLAAQDEPPELILLADDGSTDHSPAVLAELYGLTMPALGEISAASATLPSLRWLRLPPGGKARALNAALGMVSEPVVLTVDADTLLAPGALRAMRDAFAAEPELVAATGVIAPVCGPDIRGRLFQWFQGYEYVRNFLSRYAWMQLNGLLLISGAFAAFRRDAVIEVGGFDPECMVEDYELIHRLHRFSADEGRDWTVRVVGRALAVTDAPASALAFLRQRRRWFGGFLQTQYWNRDMVGNRHFGKLGTAMLTVKALDTMQPIYGVAAFIILIGALVTGTARVALPIIVIMVVKIIVDLSFHLWSLGRYKAWTGQRDGLALGPALLASFAEPLTFQLLRHVGAIWGWFAFLSGRETWVRQKRTALAPAE